MGEQRMSRSFSNVVDHLVVGAIGAKHLLDTWTKCRMIYDRMTSAIAQKTVESLEELGDLSQTGLIEAITAGLPAQLARELVRKMGTTMEHMASLLRLNPRTLQRRIDEGVLSLSESERLWELSRLFFRAVAVLESEPSAVHWFKNPLQVLGGETPLSYARTTVGVRELENILGRIEHGVYS
jgi:putative toxin-antitoxin system antitoxin component (TIGR02293 family)